MILECAVCGESLPPSREGAGRRRLYQQGRRNARARSRALAALAERYPNLYRQLYEQFKAEAGGDHGE